MDELASEIMIGAAVFFAGTLAARTSFDYKQLRRPS
jgi:hypothetical protein